MSWSIAIRVSDPVLRKKAADFMEREFRPISSFTKLKSAYIDHAPFEGRSAYHENPRTILLHCSHLHEPEDQYVYSIMRWMALRFGDKRNFRGKIGERPFIIYDGHERWSVVVTPEGKRPKDIAGSVTCCDLDGWHGWWWESEGVPRTTRAAMKLLFFVFMSQRGVEKAIRAELERLSKAWEANK